MSKSQMSILQWNMCCGINSSVGRTDLKSLADILTSLLDEFKPEIVTLQEANRIVLSYVKIVDYDLYSPTDDIATLVLKDKYRISENIPFDNRFNLLALERTDNTGAGIKVINLHLPALNVTPEEKREKIRNYIPKINSWRSKHHEKLEIVSGDFNLPPYDEVLIHESGFFANRDLKHVSKLQIKKPFALYNTSWNIFSGACGALGTFYLNRAPHGPWHIIDQIMLDPKLVLNKKVDVKVITVSNGKSLATKGSICRTRRSDQIIFQCLLRSNLDDINLWKNNLVELPNTKNPETDSVSGF